MSRSRSIDLEDSTSHVLPEGDLLVHIYKDVSLDLWCARIRVGEHVLTTRPRHGSLRTQKATINYARKFIDEMGIVGECRWKLNEDPVVNDSEVPYN